jgi:hypothetical protein
LQPAVVSLFDGRDSTPHDYDLPAAEERLRAMPAT